MEKSEYPSENKWVKQRYKLYMAIHAMEDEAGGSQVQEQTGYVGRTYLKKPVVYTQRILFNN
jgi:hypothetical protein